VDGREFLPVGTLVEMNKGNIYRISGEPIGRGGGSILYPAQKQLVRNGVMYTDGILYALKECYPVSMGHSFSRNQNGEIVPIHERSEDMQYLHRAQLLQLEEGRISRKIYQTASRMLPIRESAQSVSLTLPGGSATIVPNTVTVMDSLAEKGRSLTAWIQERGRFTPAETFRIIQQLLFALREVHQAGYLHLDIQDGNIFLKGTLRDKDELVTLIDFGCARKLVGDTTAPIRDKVIFTTRGFSAPEILLQNDGNLQLGVEADIYSVGCLALYLLTGQRANVRELIANRTGIYLKLNQLRRIKCPTHLVDALQQFLAKALDKEPENRYHSVDSMLADVMDLVEALQPYRSDLNAVKYDAFICYKHGPVDSAAALALQRQLENYRAPRGTCEKRKPFGRVFVDDGELSSCADFGQQIREALKNSGWLIVICSPDTPLSPWVSLEIDTFLEYHDRSRILAVLTGGDAQSAFPLQLKGNVNGIGEVFAPHALSNTPHEAVRKLKGDTLLKIAAPMLGTTFDALKQRHKIYRLQRLAAVTAGFLLAAVGFSAYAVNRANVIAQQAARIKEEYEKALVNESRFLSEQAEKRLEKNDPLGAMELALQALPSGKQDRPVLTEAEYVLGQALEIYTTPDSNYDTVTAVGKIETDRDSFLLDETGKYLFVWDSLKGGIQVWDAETLTQLRELFPESDYAWKPIGTYGTTIIMRQAYRIICVDFLTGKEIWSIEEPDLLSVKKSDVEQHILVFARNKGYSTDTKNAPNMLYLDVLSAGSGAVLHRVTFPMEEHLYVQQDICVSEDEKWAAVQVYDQYSNSSLYILNLETGDCRCLFDSDTDIYALRFCDDTLAVIRGKGLSIASNTGKTTTSISVKSDIFFELYNLERYDRISSYEFCDFPGVEGGCSIGLTSYDSGIAAGMGVMFICYDQCILLDQETGALVRDYTMPDSVVEIQYTKNGFEAVIADGSVCLGNYSADTAAGQDSIVVKKYWTDAVSKVVRKDCVYYVQHNPFGISTDYTIRKYQKNKYDDSYMPIWRAEESGWYVFGCCMLENGIRIILMKNDQVCLVDTAGNAQVYNIPKEYAFSYYAAPELSETMLFWSNGSAAYGMDLHTGKIDSSQISEIQPEGGWSTEMYVQSPAGKQTACYIGEEIIVRDLNGEVLCLIPANDHLLGLQFTPDEKSLLLYSEDYQVTRYCAADGVLQDRIILSNYNELSLFGSVRSNEPKWEWIDKNTMIVFAGNEGFLLDISGDSIKMKATIDYCIGYDAQQDLFILADMELPPYEIGVIRRYSLDELIREGNAVLDRQENP